MRKFLLAASSAALITVALTSEAAQRGRRQAGATDSIYVSKDTPVTARNRELNLAVERQKSEQYRGLSVEPHPAASGQAFVVQERIANLLGRLDYVPAHRVEHFRWIPEMGMTISGWRGQIVETAPAPNGIRVTVKVKPIVALGTKDYTLESYLYTDGRLVHFASEGAPSRGVTTFN